MMRLGSEQDLLDRLAEIAADSEAGAPLMVELY